VRLDPLSLPLRFSAPDAEADECVRLVELHRRRVVMRRAVRGMRMALNLPVTTFLGVSLRALPAKNEHDGGIAITLEHRDAALSVPLLVAPEADDAIADWQLWGRVFCLPLLIADDKGALHTPFRQLGEVRFAAATPRRRRRNAIKRRRPSILLRRRPARLPPRPIVHREREIIARN
jgi:Family of unknown function (DUF6101)